MPIWEIYYLKRLAFLEIFVDQSRLKGTNYRAANWLLVGSMRGYRKSGSVHHNSQGVKSVFLYLVSLEHRRMLVEDLEENPKGQNGA